MDFWRVFGNVAWIVSGGLLVWMLADMVRVRRHYDEDFLMSSREGVDELEER